jgi:two-component system sensor histidine kinase KdpD
MLNDALNLRAQGMDVVIGVIVTHGRHEIESLASGFEKLSLLPVEREGHTYLTLDIDGIIRRSPGLVLVDEAALSNPLGHRHPKRWQDILELIDRGIDVYTTLNIQHLESLNDLIAELIEAPIHETIPDLFLERADTIELVDLPAEELLVRLKQGKVYLSADIARAQAHFFQKNKLEVLREFAFRVAAQKLELGVKSEYEPEVFGGIMVYLQDEPGMPELLRAAKRLSMALKCDWYLLYIGEAKGKNFKNLGELLQLAEGLGAKIEQIFSIQIEETIKYFIDEHHIGLWILRSQTSFWKRWKNPIERLSRELLNIAIYRFSGIEQFQLKLEKKRGFGLLVFILVSASIFLLQPQIGMSLKASFLSLCCISLYYLKRYRALLEINQYQTLMLGFFQNISGLSRQTDLLNSAYQYLSKNLDYPIRIYLRDKQQVYQCLPLINTNLEEKEKGIVQWVFHRGKMAGPSSGNLINADALYFPIQAKRGCLAVIALEMDSQDSLSFAKRQNLMMMLHQFAIILEREKETEFAHTEVLQDFQNRLRDQLLLGLGQQLSQPLKELIELLPQELEGQSCKPLIQRLSSHLQVTDYFNHPNLEQEMTEQSMETLIANVLQMKAKTWASRPIRWLVEENLPKISMHLDLMRVVIENILDNIDHHANADDGIDISLHLHRDGLWVSIADLGPGFPELELGKIFEYFYQTQASTFSAGLGLGLALSERIISWHQGRIWAENRKPHGAIFNFILPLAKKKINGQNNEPND